MLNPNSHLQVQPPNPKPNSNTNPNPNSGTELQNQNQQLALQLAYEDAWRVCHPDFRRGFVSVEDACLRLLPYHMVADYEAEEDDRFLDSDTTGQMQSRSQLWDNNISTKVANFTSTFEKQANAFNLIFKKRGQGEFRSEERLIIERALLQVEQRASLELRSEIETREKAVLDAKMRMAATAQAQSRSQSHVHTEMMTRGAMRAGVFGSHGSGGQEHGGNPDGMMNGWCQNGQRANEPVDDFLNDEENVNDDAGGQDGEWMEAGGIDLNSR